MSLVSKLTFELDTLASSPEFSAMFTSVRQPNSPRACSQFQEWVLDKSETVLVKFPPSLARMMGSGKTTHTVWANEMKDVIC